MASLPQPSPLRAAIYTRVSTLEQGEHGYGLDTQLKDCQRLASDLGADVVAMYQDRDSGASWTLPGLNAMLDAAQRREFDTVIIFDPDRLSRRMAKYVVLEDELKRAGVQLRFVTIRAGNSPEDRALQQMKAVFAELDYERLTLRMMRGKRSKAERGLVVGTGVAPYGYRYLRNDRRRAYALEVDPDAAPIVQRIFHDVQEMSLRAVCDRLNADGIPTYFGSRASAGWAVPTLTGILTNPVYLGTAPYGRRDGKKRRQDPSTWLYSPAPAIVERATWDAAHAALERRRVLQQRPARSPQMEAAYPLRGMLACAHCGGALHCDVNTGYRYYVCLRSRLYYARRHNQAACPLPAVPAPALEALAWRDVVETLLDPERLRAGLVAAQAEHADADGRRKGRLDALEGEAARLRARLGRVLDEQLDQPAGSESARLLREKARQIEDSLGRLHAERARLESEPTAGLSIQQVADLEGFAADVRAGLDNASDMERRRVFQLLKLRGSVRLDQEHGIKLARRNRFSVDWNAVIQVGNSEREMCNIQTVWIGPAQAAPTPAPASE